MNDGSKKLGLVDENNAPVKSGIAGAEEPKIVFNPETHQGFAHVNAKTMAELAYILNLFRAGGKNVVSVHQITPLMSKLGGINYDCLVQSEGVIETTTSSQFVAPLCP